MADLPVMLKVAGRRCVVIGGGATAARRAGSLLAAGARVVVIAPHISDALRSLDVQVIERPYQRSDLQGAFLAVAATDDPRVNQQVSDDVRFVGPYQLLVNRVDDPAAGDITFMSHAHHGPVTVAVQTQGASPRAAGTIRRQLSSALDPDWPAMLEVVAPFRAVIQQRYDDAEARRDRLIRLTDAEAVAVLKQQGAEALRRHCERIAYGVS